MINLTPSGATIGGTSSFTIGALAVPALAAHQTVTLNQTISLPAQPPSALAGSTQFTVAMIQDADGLANPFFPHAPTQGLGLDQSSLAIPLPPQQSQSLTPAPLPELDASAVQSSASTVVWGMPFQVAATVTNNGQANAGPFTVRFFLTGTSNLATGLLLGDVVVPGLAVGASQTVTQTVRFPGQPLASLMSSNQGGSGQIVAQIDPDSQIDKASTSTTIAQSSAIIISLVGADGVIPPATPTPAKPAAKTPAKPAAKTPAKPVPAGKVHIVKPKPTRTFHQGILHLEHQILKIFPHHLKNPPVKLKRTPQG